MTRSRDILLVEAIIDGMAPAIRDYVEGEITKRLDAVKSEKPRIKVRAASDDEPALTYPQLRALALRNRALLVESSIVTKEMRDEATRPRIRVPARMGRWT